MRFSSLLSQLPSLLEQSPRDLANDPDLHGAESLERAGAGQLSFLESGNALASALEGCGAAALLIPADPSVQMQASAARIAWVACPDPRLAFAEALERLYPPRRPQPGTHPSAVIDPSCVLGEAVHIGAQVVVGADCRLGDGVILHAGVVLYHDVAIGPGCEVHAHAVLHPGTRLGSGCVIHSSAVIGSEGFGFVPTASGWRKMPQTGQVVLEDGVEVGCGSMVDRPAVGETRIGAGSKLDNLVHVAHGVVIGRGCALAGQVGIAGGARIGDGVILAGQVGVANRARIGDRAIVSSQSGVHGVIEAGQVVSGSPAIENRLWLRCTAAFNRLPEMARSLRQLRKAEL
jgi:UDP-3-O-[3-hydroxymyristoyl] glucosamine N-acyltransferase